MDKFWLAIALVLPFIVGLVSLFLRLTRIAKEEEFADEYHRKLSDYVSSRGQDTEAYGWLVHRVNKMQAQLGNEGVFAAYRPPASNHLIRNYPALLNMLPELRRWLGDWSVSDRLANEYAGTLEDLLVRHIGSLSDRHEAVANSIRNPVTWLRDGMRVVIALPVTVLGWLGIIRTGTVYRITGSRIFGVLSGITGLVGFVAAVAGLAVDWDRIVQLASSAWGKIF